MFYYNYFTGPAWIINWIETLESFYNEERKK